MKLRGSLGPSVHVWACLLPWPLPPTRTLHLNFCWVNLALPQQPCLRRSFTEGINELTLDPDSSKEKQTKKSTTVRITEESEAHTHGDKTHRLEALESSGLRDETITLFRNLPRATRGPCGAEEGPPRVILREHTPAYSHFSNPRPLSFTRVIKPNGASAVESD